MDFNEILSLSFLSMNRFWMMPRYILVNHILTGMDVTTLDCDIQMAVRFVKKKVALTLYLYHCYRSELFLWRYTQLTNTEPITRYAFGSLHHDQSNGLRSSLL